MNLWRSPLFQLLFLAYRLTKESPFDWFNLHSSLFESQQPDHQTIILPNAQQLIGTVGKYLRGGRLTRKSPFRKTQAKPIHLGLHISHS